MIRRGVLRVTWSRRERDHITHFPSSPDGHLTHRVLMSPRSRGGLGLGRNWDQSFMHELIVRGYDVTTFRMRVERFRHPWIVRGAILWHRKTGEERRVHHVRYEYIGTPRESARVALIGRRANLDEELRDVERTILGDPYTPLAKVEREWMCRPGEHPGSWLSPAARSAVRPDCLTCGTRREPREGGLVCPKCSAEGRKPNALIESLMFVRPS